MEDTHEIKHVNPELPQNPESVDTEITDIYTRMIDSLGKLGIIKFNRASGHVLTGKGINSGAPWPLSRYDIFLHAGFKHEGIIVSWKDGAETERLELKPTDENTLTTASFRRTIKKGSEIVRNFSYANGVVSDSSTTLGQSEDWKLLQKVASSLEERSAR